MTESGRGQSPDREIRAMIREHKPDLTDEQIDTLLGPLNEAGEALAEATSGRSSTPTERHDMDVVSQTTDPRGSHGLHDLQTEMATFLRTSPTATPEAQADGLIWITADFIRAEGWVVTRG